MAAAGLAELFGDDARARDLSKQAKTLLQRFEESFWCDELSTYALALDGRKQPCRVRTSNAGHCLFAGLASAQHARRIAATLTHGTPFSAWGLRPVANTEPRYNPTPYH